MKDLATVFVCPELGEQKNKDLYLAQLIKDFIRYKSGQKIEIFCPIMSPDHMQSELVPDMSIYSIPVVG